MTGFDFIIFAILAFSGLLGWHRGGLRELVTVLAIGAGFAAVGAWGAPLSSIADGVLLRLALLILVYFLGYLVVLVAGSWVVRKVAGSDKLPGDRAVGAIFGLLRGWIFGAFVFYSIGVYHTAAPLPRCVQESLTGPALQQTVLVFLRNADVTITKLSNPPSRAIPPASEITEA